MKYLFIILLLASFIIQLPAQFYINGLADKAIDEQAQKIILLRKKAKYDLALKESTSLLNYWKQQLKDRNTPSIKTNYYFSLINNYLLLNTLDSLKDNSKEAIFTLEQDLKNDLPNNQSTLANYYFLAANFQNDVLNNNTLRIDFLNQSLTLFKSILDSKAQIIPVLNELGAAYRSARKYDLAKPYLEQAITLNYQQTNTDTLDLINSLYEIGGLSYFQANYQTGLDSLLQGLALVNQFLGKNHRISTKIRRLIGILYQSLGEMKKSRDYAILALESIKNSEAQSKKGISRYYSSVSNIYARLGELELATNYLDTAISYAKEEQEVVLLIGYYHNKALLLTDSEESIKLIRKSLLLCEQQEGCTDRNRSILLQNLGNEYVTLGNLHQGLIYVTKAQALKEKNYKTLGVLLPSTYGSLALINESLGNLDLAIFYQKKSIKTVKEFRPKQSFYVALELSRLGKFYMLNNQLEESNLLLDEALAILKEKVGNKNEQTVLTYKYLSNLYQKKGQPKKALAFAHKFLNGAKYSDTRTFNVLTQIAELHITLGQIDSARLYMNQLLTASGISIGDKLEKHPVVPNFSQWDSFVGFFSYLKIEEKIEGTAQEMIKEKIIKGLQLIEDMNANYFFETSEVIFQKNVREFYDWSLNKLNNLYQTEQDSTLLSLIFNCIEKSKSIAINRNFTQKNSLWEGSIPEDILQQEKSILQDYNTIYDKYKKTPEQDSLKEKYAAQMFDLQQERENFLSNLASNYPAYYQSRYKLNVTSLANLKQLAKTTKKGIFIFHWSDRFIYRFIITPDRINFQTIATEEIEKNLVIVKSIITNNTNNSREQSYIQEKELFVNMSNQLYENIFTNQPSNSLPTNLIIVPDGKLINLPFEVLLTEKVNASSTYKTLPYLLKKHTIIYNGSATQITNKSLSTPHKSEKLYIGFGPIYQEVITTTAEGEDLANRSKIAPLLYNIEEIKNTALLFKGKQYIGSEATENNFKEQSANYKILHLAMHAILNDQFPMESYLQFAPDSAIGQDNQLHVHEIAKMQLKSDLVVLSACKTNNGKESLGAGVLGIAKAFQLAACQNLILTNWLVDDRSSSEIIYNFFKYLKTNEVPALALRKAKLTFLKNSSSIHAHPKYWAAFSYYGDVDNLPFQKTSLSIYWLFLGTGILILAIFLKVRY